MALRIAFRPVTHIEERTRLSFTNLTALFGRILPHIGELGQRLDRSLTEPMGIDPETKVGKAGALFAVRESSSKWSDVGTFFRLQWLYPIWARLTPICH